MEEDLCSIVAHVRNPGTEERFKMLTGKDSEVIQFLDEDNEMRAFLKNVFGLVDQSVTKYQSRSFTSLMVNFGCTGGQIVLSIVQKTCNTSERINSMSK